MSQAALAPQSPLTPWPFPFALADWEQTPPTVQAHLTALHQEVAQLKARVDTPEARTQATSQTSSRPPSSDSPFRKAYPKQDRTTSGRPGAKPGHPGVRQTLLSPTATEHLLPTACRCGSTTLAPATPY